MEGRIGPDNDTLVQFLDMDGDPNEGHQDDEQPPEKPKVKVSGKPPEGDLEPEVEIDLTETPAKDAEAPVEEPPPAAAADSVEAGATEPDADETSRKGEEKPTPWQRAAQLNRELAEEKRLREEATNRLAASEQRLQQIEAYLQQQAQLAQQRVAQQQTELNGKAPAEPAKMPEFEENPLGNLAQRQSLTEQIIQQFNERQQRLEAQSVRQQFESRINQEEAAYVQRANPDYYNARNWLIESAWREGRAAGMNDQQINDTIEAYRIQFARAAWTQNKPIAEIVEQVALSRGYRPKEAEPALEVQKTNPEAAKAKVQQAAQRERQASASLATAARTTGRPQTKITREMILQMTESEMDALDRERPGWMDEYMRES
jgi:hypothetical protein